MYVHNYICRNSSAALAVSAWVRLVDCGRDIVYKGYAATRDAYVELTYLCIIILLVT